MVASEFSRKELEALRFIRNSLTQQARSPSIREIQRALGYASPRSAALIVDRLIGRKCLQRRSNGLLRVIQDLAEDDVQARTVPIPLLGTAPCGAPLLADENIEAMIPVATTLAKPPHRYFLLRAKGDSMNKARINDHDLVLVRQQLFAENGDVVVAMIDGEATIKEFRRTNTVVILRPRSSSNLHQPIILSTDFQIQGVVITAIPRLE
jgi:repressor LexA